MFYNMIGMISETMTIVRLSLIRLEDNNKISEGGRNKSVQWGNWIACFLCVKYTGF